MLSIQILGSGAAVPTLKRGTTSQYLNFNERRILIDCGEGTQLQLRKFGIKFQRLQYIFISHLHGDHFLGLQGLLSSMHLLGRKNKIIIFAPPELKEIFYFQNKLIGNYIGYEIEFKDLNYKEKTLILEDKSIEVYTFPLKHRITCYGFLFKEKTKERNIIPEKIDEFKLTIPEIIQLKRGEDIKINKKIISHEECTSPPPLPVSYAFCTDTKMIESLPEIISEASILYHEATFLHEELERAKATFHTTAKQAAEIAKQANVKQLLLGHFSARYKKTDVLLKEAKSIFENTICVEDGDIFRID